MFAGISPFAYLLSQLCWRPLPLAALLVANLLSKSDLVANLLSKSNLVATVDPGASTLLA